MSSPTLSRWSPITSFPTQPLTKSGLLLLDHTDGEVEICTKSHTELRSLTPMARTTATGNANNNRASWNDRDMDLIMTLTTHRIVFQTSSSSPFTSSNFVHLSNIQSHSVTGGEWISNRSYKIIISTLTHGEFNFCFRGKFPKQDRDSFHLHLEKALTRRQWEEASRLHHRSNAAASSSSRTTTTPMAANNNSNSGIGRYHNNPTKSTGVGVAAILERNRLRHEHNAKLATQAFDHHHHPSKKATKKQREQEVETLMREAKELTNVIHRYVATLEKNSKSDNNNNNEGNDQELTSMLSHMGMITAIPDKNTSNSKSSMIYYETLARQISDFLLQNKAFSIAKGGNGIMTLTDVYCLFNRARGANMISPEDLITSLEQMDRLGLKMKIREFEHGSGVSVLQETRFDDSAIVQKITNYINRKGSNSCGSGGRVSVGVTALEAGRILKISPLLAKEQLLSAEQNGYLCRDITLEGTRFFCNLFLEY